MADNGRNEVLVLGVGNILLKDEGIGVHVVKAMQDVQLPDSVTLFDGGAGGIDLLEQIERADRLIIIDAIDAGDEPGTVFRFKPDEVKALLDEHKTSLHQVDLYDTLKLAKFIGCYPETVIIGIQPKEIAWGTEPTPDISAQIPRVIDLVTREILAIKGEPYCGGSDKQWV
ncbi:MAG: HyaD/HybD family hydrogenase maturation endopeptidase [Firmicutes bacterium]|nr:HyaD/HybD family hydrogenase maturation endopeptidase [Bacillota bacterium]